MGVYVKTDGVSSVTGGPWVWDGAAPWAESGSATPLGTIGPGFTWPPTPPVIGEQRAALNVYADATHGVGTGDDTKFLQSALDQVSTALGITTVIIHDGTWMINGVNPAGVGIGGYYSAGLLPRSGTQLILTAGATLKVIPNGSPGYSCIYIGKDTDDVTVTGGRILGDRATHDYSDLSYPTHEGGYGVAIEGASNVVIEGVSVSGCTGDSIFVGGRGLVGYPGHEEARRITIRECSLDGARRNNISVVDATLVLVENNLITNAGTNDGIHDGTTPRAGIDIEGYGEGVGEAGIDYQVPAKVTVRGNRFVGNAANSVNAYNPYQTVITGNFADSSMTFSFATEAVISNNVLVNLSNTTNPGIGSAAFPVGHAGYAAKAVVTGNVIRGFGTGVLVQRDKVIVAGNQISEFAGAGVTSYTATDVAITSNQISDGSSAAIGVSVYGSTDVMVASNKVRNVSVGLSVTGATTKTTLIGNRVTKAYQGVNVTGAQVTVKGNMIDLPGHASGQSYDIVWAADADVLCVGNTIRNSSTYAISAASGASGASRIIGNSIVGATAITPAINCTGGTHHVLGNDIFYAQASVVIYAIGVISGSGSRVIGNRIQNTLAGSFTKVIDSSGATGTTISDNVLPSSATPIAPNVTDIIGPNTVLGGGVIAKSANYTATVTDRTILATGGAGGITITLPAAMASLRYEVKKVDAGAGAVTVATTSSQTIDGATTKSLPARYDKVTVVSDGTAWYVTA